MNTNKRFKQLQMTTMNKLPRCQSKSITKQFLLQMYKMGKDQEAKYYFNSYQPQIKK